MQNRSGRRDIDWLRRVVRGHFKRSWRRVFAKLDARQPEMTPVPSIAHTKERRTNATRR